MGDRKTDTKNDRQMDGHTETRQTGHWAFEKIHTYTVCYYISFLFTFLHNKTRPPLPVDPPLFSSSIYHTSAQFVWHINRYSLNSCILVLWFHFSFWLCTLNIQSMKLQMYTVGSIISIIRCWGPGFWFITHVRHSDSPVISSLYVCNLSGLPSAELQSLWLPNCTCFALLTLLLFTSPGVLWQQHISFYWWSIWVWHRDWE